MTELGTHRKRSPSSLVFVLSPLRNVAVRQEATTTTKVAFRTSDTKECLPVESFFNCCDSNFGKERVFTLRKWMW